MSDREPVLALMIPAGDKPAYQVRVTADLPTISKIVGGDLEAVSLGDDAVLYINENGKDLGLPVNAHATRMLAVSPYPLGIPGDFIAGDGVAFGVLNPDGHSDGYEYDVPPSVLDLIARAGVPMDPTPAS